MARVELIMPKMGESIMEATILTWLKKPGDKVELEESVLEVATDKVDTEVPSTHAGVLVELLAKEFFLLKSERKLSQLRVCPYQNQLRKKQNHQHLLQFRLPLTAIPHQPTILLHRDSIHPL